MGVFSKSYSVLLNCSFPLMSKQQQFSRHEAKCLFHWTETFQIWGWFELKEVSSILLNSGESQAFKPDIQIITGHCIISWKEKGFELLWSFACICAYVTILELGWCKTFLNRFDIKPNGPVRGSINWILPISDQIFLIMMEKTWRPSVVLTH